MQKFWNSILAFFSKKERLKQIAMVVATIRRVLENPALDMIKELTETKVDNAIIDAARAIVAEIDDRLKAVNGRVAIDKEAVLANVQKRLQEKFA